MSAPSRKGYQRLARCAAAPETQRRESENAKKIQERHARLFYQRHGVCQAKVRRRAAVSPRTVRSESMFKPMPILEAKPVITLINLAPAGYGSCEGSLVIREWRAVVLFSAEIPCWSRSGLRSPKGGNNGSRLLLHLFPLVSVIAKTSGAFCVRKDAGRCRLACVG